MKLIKKNILHTVNSAFETEFETPFSAEEIIDILSEKKEGRVSKDEIIDVLSNSDFSCEITPERVIEVMTSKYVNGTNVIDIIAKSSSLTEEQVKEAFFTYRQFIDKLVENKNIEKIDISIPYFGKLKMKVKQGRKAGSKYTYYSKIGGDAEYKVLDKDEPSYLRFFVEIKPEIQSKLKEASINKRG